MFVCLDEGRNCVKGVQLEFYQHLHGFMVPLPGILEVHWLAGVAGMALCSWTSTKNGPYGPPMNLQLKFCQPHPTLWLECTGFMSACCILVSKPQKRHCC